MTCMMHLEQFQISENTGQYCSNTPIYEITCTLGTKWLVCNKCLDFEDFSRDTNKKVRFSNDCC